MYPKGNQIPCGSTTAENMACASRNLELLGKNDEEQLKMSEER